MPALSPTMTQGNIGQWQKKVGDQVAPGDVLVEIETDKAQMDFECQDEGYIAKIFIEAGEKDVSVGRPLVLLVDDKADIEKFADFSAAAGAVESAPTPIPLAADAPVPVAAAPSSPAAAPAAPAATPAPAQGRAEVGRELRGRAGWTVNNGDPRVFASPLAKKLVTEKGYELAAISGTGPNGRIVKADVDSYKPAPKAAPVAAKQPAAPKAPAAAPGASFVDIPLSNVRKVIASRLLESKVTIPHFYLTVEIDADKILKLREVLNAQANGKFKLSVNDFVVKASSIALKDVPEVNSSWQETFIRQHNSADIAIAVATDNGLITPIVTRAETKGLAAISNNIKELAERARVNKLQPHEFQGGTFTISNLGMYGVQHFTAIINPPHASILAVGGIEDKLVLDDAAEKGFAVRKVMHVTLSGDHRVVDGAVGAKWLQKFKAYIENPLTMLL
ncbi:2-oxoacid dehydrogenases acyltransferase-domain-containing protein [Blyttiomyces helicus]|uniref:Acetyltransferase component of pyruvate dehydrogenase complex n=1 Tax=Blyttiomyces helicus TaxID=388810 RepID=A0A4P9WJ32_9FUNG|nr:2-oxoacid dehydrogenases acyltransferase-domain-containing protein [Blyttiomyces helicus]|eukprot:RKO92919.1 2-oxoacid dehydrogenases acyltransferase-domain-containing protein [Blyttiomyces helicus]